MKHYIRNRRLGKPLPLSDYLATALDAILKEPKKRDPKAKPRKAA